MYIVIIILAVIFYPISCFYRELFYTICDRDAILDAILANFFLLLSIVRVIIQWYKKKKKKGLQNHVDEIIGRYVAVDFPPRFRKP